MTWKFVFQFVWNKKIISMGNQMVMSEIRNQIISRAFCQNSNEYTIWLPFNIMGDKLHLQSWVTEALP